MLKPFHIWLAAGVVAFIALVLIFGRDSEPVRNGDPGVYARIEATSDCDALEGEFRRAETNRQNAQASGATRLAEVNLTYMLAAEERLNTLGC